MHLHAVVACLAMTGAGQTELLDFTATWCGPCRQMAPMVDALAAQGNPIRKVDYDQNRELVVRYNVTAIPCFVMLVDGQEVDRAVGGVSQVRLQQMLSLAQRGTSGPGAGTAPPMPGRMAGASPSAANLRRRFPGTRTIAVQPAWPASGRGYAIDVCSAGRHAATHASAQRAQHRPACDCRSHRRSGTASRGTFGRGHGA